MRREKIKTVFIFVLLVGIVSMTIVYANFTSRLTIRSNTRINATNWDIHFENLVQQTLPGNSGTEIISSAAIQPGSTIISGLEMNLKKPGDYIVYTFDIYNAGDIDAELNYYMLGTPICESNTSFCSNVEYSLNYTNGQPIRIGDVLNSKSRINATMRIGLSSSVTSMPSSSIDVTNLNAVFDYVQR